MSDGVSYKLGFLQGRLRGYDGEESLLKLAPIQEFNAPFSNSVAITSLGVK